jgi:hypothetical protein
VLLSIMNVIGEARTWTNEEGNLMAQLPYWVISGTIHALTRRFMSKGLSVHPSQPQVRGAQPSHLGPPPTKPGVWVGERYGIWHGTVSSPYWFFVHGIWSM